MTTADLIGGALALLVLGFFGWAFIEAALNERNNDYDNHGA